MIIFCSFGHDDDDKTWISIYEQLAFVNSDVTINNPHNKWSCHACTYLNWPKAIRCTQCQRNRSTSPPSPHQQQQQHNLVVVPKQQSDEHHEHTLTTMMTGSRPNPASSPPIMAITNGNNMNSSNCAEAAATNQTTIPLMIQSQQPWRSSPTSNVGGDGQQQMQQPGDYLNHGRGGAIEKRRFHGKGVKPPPLPRSPSPQPLAQSSPHQQPDLAGLDSYFNRINIRGGVGGSTTTSGNTTSLMTGCKSTLKWPCTICTFENWPKASKCSMCCTPRIGGSATGGNY